MDTSEIKEILRKVDLFAKLDDELLDTFAAASNVVGFEAGERLVSQGDPASRVVVIVEGEVEIRRASRPVAIFGPGDVGGDLSLLSGEPHSMNAVAKTSGRAVALGADEFRAAIRHHPEVAWAFIRVLISRIYLLFEEIDRVRRQMPPQTDLPRVHGGPKPQ